MKNRRLALLSCIPALLAIAACSNAPADTAPVSSEAADTAATDAEGQTDYTEDARQQQRQAFMTACTSRELPSQIFETQDPVPCEALHARALASADAAMALLDSYGPDGAALTSDLAQVRQRLAHVEWTESTTGGSTLASGKLDDYEVTVTKRDNIRYLSFNWQGPAGPVPVDMADALALQGAKLALVACYDGPPDEQGQAWRVTPVRGGAFDLIVNTRTGPSGSAISSYSASTPMDGPRQTLKALHESDPDWVVCG